MEITHSSDTWIEYFHSRAIQIQYCMLADSIKVENWQKNTIKVVNNNMCALSLFEEQTEIKLPCSSALL